MRSTKYVNIYTGLPLKGSCSILKIPSITDYFFILALSLIFWGTMTQIGLKILVIVDPLVASLYFLVLILFLCPNRNTIAPQIISGCNHYLENWVVRNLALQHCVVIMSLPSTLLPIPPSMLEQSTLKLIITLCRNNICRSNYIFNLFNLRTSSLMALLKV